MIKLQTTTILFIGLTLVSMGLFNKLFGQTKINASTSVSPTTSGGHNEDWDFYFSNVNDKLSSLFVDLSLHNVAPIKDKPNIMWISIKMNNPREDGLSSSEESNLLAEIEDHLVDGINLKFNSVYVGRLTSNGQRDLYFYLGDTTGYDKVVSNIMVAYSKYQFEYGSKADKDWSGYFDLLYPSPQQFQSIQNRRVIDQLEKNGDKLTKAREVDHWMFFKTDNDRGKFLTKIKPDNFIIVDKDYDKKLGKLPYRLHIKRIDKVDWDSVDYYVIQLWKLATECNGEYDGWETSVQKD